MTHPSVPLHDPSSENGQQDLRSAAASRSSAASELLRLQHVSQAFPAAGGGILNVLADVTLTLHNGEIVALLGKSGSGKSTILRLLARLITPSEGTVDSPGPLLNGGTPDTALVFQSFALMPWLTVRDNVELGLRSAGISRAERVQRAGEAIDAIGLDGFENAYPRELSGGMRQRVGFARALVQRPDVLLLDEPFSALDVLTAENLRTELMSMWQTPQFPTRAMFLVTHNIEEAVLLADRVLVLAGTPATITAEVAVRLPRPRDRRSPTFAALVDELYTVLTGRDAASSGADIAPTPVTHPLPAATVGGLAGLLEIVVSHGGQADLPDLADELSFGIDDLLPLVDAAELLGMLEVSGAQAFLTDEGWAWQAADVHESKRRFAELAVARAPLVGTIVRGLEHSNDGALFDSFILDLLRQGFPAAQAQRQLELAIDWGRYGELFDYDAGSGELVLAEVAHEIARFLDEQPPGL